MSQTGKKLNRKSIEALYDQIDPDKRGYLNLENLKKIYEPLLPDIQEMVRDRLRKFVIDYQTFIINRERFIQLFSKTPTPCVNIQLGHIKETQRIRELSPTELRSVINKRLENKVVNTYKPKFIKKNRSSSRPLMLLESGDKMNRNKDLTHVRKAYFSSIS
jgi:hypothetical protein